MKKKFIFILLLFSVHSFAQNLPSSNKDSLTIRLFCGPSRLDSTKVPLYVINGHQYVDQKAILGLLNPSDIEEINVLAGVNAGLYGGAGVNGVLIINLKSNVKMLTLTQLFDKFRVKKNARKLNVYVNYEKINYPDNFPVGSNWIKKIKVMKKPSANILDKEYILLLGNRP